MYSSIALQRQWSRLACLCRYSTSIDGQRLPEIGKSSDGISPPIRIPRGPTDILQALAATVGNDPTAAHYKYHDDPYLTPLSNYRKRAYALSAESGRKAAAWIRDEHAEWFTTRVWDPPGRVKTPHFNADPRIPAYAPKPIYNNESKVTEDDLRYTISNALVEDSTKVYELLGGADNISDEVKLAFLQLLCFYNEKESDSMEWLEEKWFSAVTRERHSATWKLGGLAERIFNSMDPKTPQAYCSIIQGMAKYYQAERAHQLAQEATESGIPLSTRVYNSLIVCIGFLCEGSALRMQKLEDMLRQMDEQGISPNANTLSACLKSLSVWGGGRMLQQKALQLLADFRTIGIHPNLSAYYYLLCLFCKERGPRTDILTCILNDLESRDKLEPQEPSDTNFFITAMAVCSDHLEDMAMAERVHALLMKDDNYKLVGDAYKESIYYRHFVTVACKRAPLEKTTKLLDDLVPNVYVPEPTVMHKIIECFEVGGLGMRLAQAWAQLVVFGLAKRVDLVERLLDAMCNCYQFQDAEVKEKMREAAVDILKFGQEVEEDLVTKQHRSPPKKLSAAGLCNIIELCSAEAAAGDECWTWIAQALQRLKSGETPGAPPRPALLVALASRAATLGHTAVAAEAVSYLSEYGYEEAREASVQALAATLGRSEAETRAVLQQPRPHLLTTLHPAVQPIVDAYLMSDSSVKKPQARKQDASTSSDSDSDSSSDDETK